MKKFEMLEQYQTQNDGVEATKRKYFEKAVEAEEIFNAAKIELDEIIHVELATGTDKSTEKVKAIEKIAAAEKNLVQTKSENAKAHEYFATVGGNLKASEVVQAYLHEYMPQVRAEHLPSIQERVKQATDLMLSAYYDFHNLKREYRGLRDEMVTMNEQAQVLGQQQGGFYMANPFDSDDLTGIDLNELSAQLINISNGNPLNSKINYIEKPFGGNK